jgi:hypothetical protein
VAEKGAKGPIFEGNMLPEKCTPKIGANIGAITGILLNKGLIGSGGASHTKQPSLILSV